MSFHVLSQELLEVFFHLSMPMFFTAAMLVIDAWALIVMSKLKVKKRIFGQ